MADGEFHSIRLARWIQTVMKVHVVLRINAGTWVRVNGRWHKAGGLAVRGRPRLFWPVRVIRDRRVADFGINRLAVWSSAEDERWLVISEVDDPARMEAIYRHRFWIESLIIDPAGLLEG